MSYGYGLAQEFIKKPSHALVFGLIMLGVGLFVSISSWNELQNLPAQPKLIEITQAQDAYKSKSDEPLWVSLQNSKWDCETIKAIGGRNQETEIIATDFDQRIIVLVDFSDKLTCNEIIQNNPTGYLTQMSERRYKIFAESGEFNLSKYPKAEQFFDLCAYCGRGNAGIGVVLGVFLSIGGLSLYPLSRREHNKKFSRLKKFVPRKRA
jgi:hypothetical protein